MKRLFRVFAKVTVLGVVGLFGLLWLEHRSDVTLPTPTGPFAVGRVTYAWADEAHLDALAPTPGTKRELLVWVWYPAAAGQSGAAMDDYVPAQMKAAGARAGADARAKAPSLVVRVLSGVIRLLSKDESQVHGHSLRNPDVSPRQPSYPVVMMRAGASSGVANYSTLAEDLASHGYIVVGLDAPYRTGRVVFPDGRVIARTQENNPEMYSGQEFVRVGNKLLAAWTADMGFVLDQFGRLNSSDASGKFTGRLDLARVGAFGHSFGGAQAAQFCHEDLRCKAGIDIDGAPLGSVVQEGIHHPFMFLVSAHVESSDPESQKVKADIRSIYDRLPPDGRLFVEIRGANHFTFSDDGALLKSHLVRGALRLFGQLGIAGPRQLAVTSYCVRSFFDAYLKGLGAPPLKIASPLYPEILVLE